MNNRSLHLLAALFLTPLTALYAAVASMKVPPGICRTETSLDSGWRFVLPGPKAAVGDTAPSAPGFDDKDWRQVDVPHDWSIEDLAGHEGPFDPRSIGGTSQGYTVGGVGWYRKTFALPDSMKGRSVSIRFDGVYMNAEFWLNGHALGNHPYGYTSFHFDLTPYLNYGAQPNVLSVKVDATGQTSRWYSGAGIYRHVWLTVTSPLHIKPWGVFVTTPAVSPEAAVVHVRTQVENRSGADVTFTVRTRVLDAEGRTVASSSADQPVAIKASAEIEVEQTLSVNRPGLWSPDRPALYQLASTIVVDGKPVDDVVTAFGIRTLKIDATNGFVLNGQSIKLRGGCVHHDNGCLGSAAFDRAEERRVELLKAAGFNAIRTSHNPPSPAFLDACDRLGMFVMDEAFDCWEKPKKPQDYSRFFKEWWKRDIDAMVLRDRNHPCVVIWSIGNEVQDQEQSAVAALTKELSDYVRHLDATRPVTQAFPPNRKWEALFVSFDSLDLSGYNYRMGRYRPDHAIRPRQVIVGTESFPFACYDNWMAVMKYPYVIGDFVWTAQDYLGDGGLGRTVPGRTPLSATNAPPRSEEGVFTVSNCGDFDLCGFTKPAGYYRQAVWGAGHQLSAFAVALGRDGREEEVKGWGWVDERLSWTWPGREGKPITVHVYSHYPQARLLLNGADLGVRETTAKTKFTGTWTVPYAPGDLVAIGLDQAGREMERWALHSAGPAAAIRLTPDRKTMRAGTQDLAFVTVEIVDSHGVIQPNRYDQVHFTVTGPAKLLGVGNGDPKSMESFQQPQRKVFRGRCLVVIKAGDSPGPVTLTARVDGLPDATEVLKAEPQGPDSGTGESRNNK